MSLIRFGHIFMMIKHCVRLARDAVRKHVVFCVFVAFALGIVVNEQFRPVVWLGLCGAFVSLLIAVWGRLRKLFLLFVLLAVACSGTLYCRAVCFLPPSHIQRMSKRIDHKTSRFIGIVQSDVKQVQALGRYQTFEFLLKRIIDEKGQDFKVAGVVQARVFHDINIAPGDRLEIQGTLHRPFEFESGKFSYEKYLRQRRIFFMLTVGRNGFVRIVDPEKPKPIFVRLREYLKSRVDEYFPEFEGGILKAVLLGDRTHISREVRDVFSKTGTAHVLAISGLHMGILLLIFLFVLGFLPVGLNARYALAIILLLLYLPVAGARVSVIRSGIMSVVFLYAFIAERRPCSLNALGLAGLIILLMNPLELYAIGFQLSFSAVSSLILFYEPVVKGVQKVFPGFWSVAQQSFAASFSAWLGVAGWVMYYFELVSPIGLLANVVVVAMTAVLIAAGVMFFVAALLGQHWLASIMAMNVVLLLRVLVYGVVLLERVPFGYCTGIEMNAWMCGVYYAILLVIAAVVYIRKPSVSRGLS